MTGQRKMVFSAVFLAAVTVLSMVGPEWLARCQDKTMLNQIVAEETEGVTEGYRYKLSSNEKLYLLSRCLEHQVIPESELSARVRAKNREADYEDVTGSYAFVINRQGPSGKEITEEEIFEVCSRELLVMEELGILPGGVRKVEAASYSADLYSAIDVLEPQNNMAVWKVSLSTSQQNADKTNRLIDAYVDADTGKIYGFYVRTEHTWQEMDPKSMAEAWGDYLGLSGMESYAPSNPLLETAQDYVKYRFPGMDQSSTVVTIGFYEGINELFLKIEK